MKKFRRAQREGLREGRDARRLQGDAGTKRSPPPAHAATRPPPTRKTSGIFCALMAKMPEHLTPTQRLRGWRQPAGGGGRRRGAVQAAQSAAGPPSRSTPTPPTPKDRPTHLASAQTLIHRPKGSNSASKKLPRWLTSTRQQKLHREWGEGKISAREVPMWLGTSVAVFVASLWLSRSLCESGSRTEHSGARDRTGQSPIVIGSTYPTVSTKHSDHQPSRL